MEESIHARAVHHRGWWLKHVPWAKHQLKSTLDNRFAVPGCINFIDARTKWFDQHVQQALAGGIIEQARQPASSSPDNELIRLVTRIRFQSNTVIISGLMNMVRPDVTSARVYFLQSNVNMVAIKVQVLVV